MTSGLEHFKRNTCVSPTHPHRVSFLAEGSRAGPQQITEMDFIQARCSVSVLSEFPFRCLAALCSAGLSTANCHQLCPPPQRGSLLLHTSTGALIVSLHLFPSVFVLPNQSPPVLIFTQVHQPCSWSLKCSDHDVTFEELSSASWILVATLTCQP